PTLRPWLRAPPAWRWLPWLLLLALGVRLAVDLPACWLDEVFSLFWASKPAGDIVRVGLTLTEDKHPPLYYLLLHGWTGLFGATDAAVRSLGVLLGALAVWPVYGLGLITQPAPADRPDHAWRCCAPAAPAGAQPLPGLVQPGGAHVHAGHHLWALTGPTPGCEPYRQTATRGLTAPGRKIATFFWYGLAIGGLLAACYSYLFAAFLLPVAGLWWLVVAAPHRRKRTIEIAPDSRTAERSPAWTQDRSAQADLAAERCSAGNSFGALAPSHHGPALSCPWPWPRGRKSAGLRPRRGRPFDDLWPTLARLLTAYTCARRPGRRRSSGRGRGRAALIGLAEGVRQKGRRGLLVLLWLVIPLLLGNFLLATDATVFAEARFFIPLVPGPVPGLGTRPARADAVAAVAGEGGNHQPSVALPGRAAVRVAGGPGLAARGLAHGRAGGVALCQTRRCVAPGGVDPANLVRAWLGGRFPLVTELYPAGIAIRAYATRYRLTGLPATAAAVDGPAQVDGAVRPAGCTLEARPGDCRPAVLHPPAAGRM
ncbi:MAG: hypothetical protein IPO15_16695, partial [Anaerolineae bacterium]|nr:hypothetical protein [Anaerolineae bacterium]